MPDESGPSGGTILTVSKHADSGMVVSDPPGIRCGTCEPGLPCAPGSPSGHTCDFGFEPGTMISLSLVGQSIYTDYVCGSEPDMAVITCSFVFTTSITMGVWGDK